MKQAQKLLKLGEIDGVKFLAWKSSGVKFWTNSMSGIRITIEDIWQAKTGHIVQPGAYTEGGGEEIRRRMARCEQQ